MPAGGRGAHSPAEPRGSHQTPNPLELLSSYFNKPSRGLAPYLNKLSRQLAFFYPPRHSSLSTSHANKSPPQQLPRGGAAHPSTQGAAPTESLRRGGCAGPKARADSAGSLRPHPSPRRSAIAQSQWPAPSGEPAGHAQRVFMAIPKSPSTTACAAGTPRSKEPQHHSPHSRDTPFQRAPAPQPAPQGHPVPKSPSTTAAPQGHPVPKSPSTTAHTTGTPHPKEPQHHSLRRRDTPDSIQ